MYVSSRSGDGRPAYKLLYAPFTFYLYVHEITVTRRNVRQQSSLQFHFKILRKIYVPPLQGIK